MTIAIINGNIDIIDQRAFILIDGLDPHINFRMELTELHQSGYQPLNGKTRLHGHCQRAFGTAGNQPFRRLTDRTEDGTDVLVISLAFLGQ